MQKVGREISIGILNELKTLISSRNVNISSINLIYLMVDRDGGYAEFCGESLDFDKLMSFKYISMYDEIKIESYVFMYDIPSLVSYFGGLSLNSFYTDSIVTLPKRVVVDSSYPMLSSLVRKTDSGKWSRCLVVNPKYLGSINYEFAHIYMDSGNCYYKEYYSGGSVSCFRYGFGNMNVDCMLEAIVESCNKSKYSIDNIWIMGNGDLGSQNLRCLQSGEYSLVIG